MNLHDGIEAEERLVGRRTLAAAVGVQADISRQHRTKRLHIAAARRREKRFGKREATLLFHLETRSALTDMGAREQPAGDKPPGRARWRTTAGPLPRWIARSRRPGRTIRPSPTRW